MTRSQPLVLSLQPAEFSGSSPQIAQFEANLVDHFGLGEEAHYGLGTTTCSPCADDCDSD